jgi:UDP-3-O-[3-hydroxymyristoyl] glucosamine N-acyltransferase
MKINAQRIAQLINGKVEGDENVEVSSFGKIEEAQKEQLTFLANPKYEEYLYTTNASIIIVNDTLELKQPVVATLIRVADAYISFANLLQQYQQMMQAQLKGIQQPSYVNASAKLGNDVFIGAFTYVGDNAVIGNNVKLYPGVYIGDEVKVGDNTIIHPGVKIYFGCVIGSNVTIHAGTVIGGDGFGFAPQENGSYKKVPQIGNVVIEDNVEVGCNSTIDRATVGSTIIRNGTKLDNLIQIAHNVEIGCNTVIAAQTGISGSTKIGQNSMIGGQVGIVGHLQIEDGTKINAQSGVTKSIKQKNTAVTGSPAYDYTSALRSQALSRNLPQMEKRLAELEKLVQQLLQEKIGF